MNETTAEKMLVIEKQDTLGENEEDSRVASIDYKEKKAKMKSMRRMKEVEKIENAASSLEVSYRVMKQAKSVASSFRGRRCIKVIPSTTIVDPNDIQLQLDNDVYKFDK